MISRKTTFRLLAFFILIVSFLTFYYIITRGPASWDKIERTKTLRVLTDYSVNNYYMEDGIAKGFNYQLIKLFADSLGFDLDVTVETDIQKRLSMFQGGNYAILLDNIPITEHLKEKIQFTDPVLTNRLVLVQNSTKTRTINLSMLVNTDTVFVSRTSLYIDVIDNMAQLLIPSFTIVYDTLNTTETLNNRVARGEISYTISDYLTARVSKHLYKNLNISTIIGQEQNVAWAIVDDAILQHKINEFLYRIKTTNHQLFHMLFFESYKGNF